MKKFLAIIPIFFFCFSCSAPENDVLVPAAKNDNASRPGPVVNVVDPTKLGKVVFYPNTNHERHWYFFPNGLLKKIVTPTGTLIQNFSYDANQNLRHTQFFGDTFFIGSPFTRTFTYDSSNHVTSINNVPITYNSDSNSYTSGIYTLELNNDFLLVNEWYLYTDTGEEPGEIISYPISGVRFHYNSGNNTSHYLEGSPSGSYYLHDNKINPFKAALLPICRAMQLDFFGYFSPKWAHSQYNSVNNVRKEYYESEDPESSVFEYTYNALNLPVTQTRKSYYFSTLESTNLNILYYYQGDIIPNSSRQ